jgi:phage-related minor tail protein
MTKPLRVWLGWAAAEPKAGDGLPFRRSSAIGGTVGRIASLEHDLDRLVGGWNQHLPQVLAAVSEARQVARQAKIKEEQVHALAAQVELLTAEVAELRTRLDRPNGRSRELPKQRGANPAAAKSRSMGV